MKQNLKNGIAAQGFDVVGFFKENQAIKGNSSLFTEHQGAKYFFDNQTDKDEFISNPDQYPPQYGGFCAIAMSEGNFSNPNPKSFIIQDEKLYLFTQMLFGIIDVKRQWMKAPKEKQALADKAWEKLKND